MSKTLFEQVRYYLLRASMLSMLIGLLWSRTLISVGEVAFFIVAMLRPDVLSYIRRFYSSFLNWSVQLLLLVPFISFFWSDDKMVWLRMVSVKGPFFLLPLAFFIYKDEVGRKEVKAIIVLLITFVTAGSLWSFFNYFSNAGYYHKMYLQASILPTPMSNDHIFFSELCAVVVLLILSVINDVKDVLLKMILGLIGIWLIAYLHILAARMGLLSLYIILAAYLVSGVISKATRKWSLIILVAVISLSAAAYFIFPTLQNRIAYFRYDLYEFRHGNYKTGLNDTPRLISLQAGWDIAKNNLLYGVGYGDLYTELDNFHNKNYPALTPDYRMFTTCEWLIYGMSNGIWGIIALFIVLFTPLLYAMRTKNRTMIAFQMAMIFTITVEVNLSRQHPIFIYLFFSWLLMMVSAGKFSENKLI